MKAAYDEIADWYQNDFLPAHRVTRSASGGR